MKKRRLRLILVAAVMALAPIGMTTFARPETAQAASHKTRKAKLVLPKGYTKQALLKAYKGKPSKSFIKASMKGMQVNSFSRNSLPESLKDNKKLVKPNKLTAAQREELADYSLRLINQVRDQLDLPAWKASEGTMKLAQDIADEYTKHKFGIQNGNHYVAGIVRACKKNGLNLDDNYVEDMAGFSESKSKLSMTTLKKNIYFGLKQMIFGYVGSGEKYRTNPKLYREWEHAGDLFNTQGSKHDGDFNYFGFSISKVRNVYSLHFISVPDFVVKSDTYNKDFKA